MVVVLALIKPKRLFVQIPEQMKRLHAHVSSLNGPLEEAPEVLKAVRVNIAANIGYCMVNDVVRILIGQAVIGPEGIGMNLRAFQDVLANVALQFALCGCLSTTFREPRGRLSWRFYAQASPITGVMC